MARRFPVFGKVGGALSAVGKRKLIIGTGVLGIASISAYALVKPKPKPPVSVAGAVPRLGHHMGERNSAPSHYNDELMHDVDVLKAKKATTSGSSYAGPFGHALANRPAVPPQPKIIPAAQPLPAHHAALATDPPSSQPAVPPTFGGGAGQTPPRASGAEAGTYNDARYKAYTAEISMLMGQMASSLPATTVVLKPVAKPVDPPAGPAYGPIARVASSNRMPFGAPRQATAILIPAGHGVYGVTKLAVSSDQAASPVEVQALSGPIAGDDMLGTFSREGDRLVVKLNSITLKDGEQEAINALVVTPDTMRTAVATSVNEHYMNRIVLPAAAAFVEALGGSLGQSGSIEQTSPLGGLTVFSHVNPAQAVAAGAGNAAGTLGQIIQKDAPNGPTVKLATGTDVGVLFLSPLKAAASP